MNEKRRLEAIFAKGNLAREKYTVLKEISDFKD